MSEPFFKPEDFPEMRQLCREAAANHANAKRDAEIERLRAELRLESVARDEIQVERDRLREALERVDAWFAEAGWQGKGELPALVRAALEGK